MSTLGDIVLRIFDLAVAYARERLGNAVHATDTLVVTREDLQRVVVELNLTAASLTLAQVDLLRQLGELEARAAYERGRASAPEDTVIVEPDGSEEFTQPFRKE